VGLALLFGVLDPFYVMYILGGVYLLLGIAAFATGRHTSLRGAVGATKQSPAADEIASAQTAGLATGRPTSLRGAVGATKQSPAADEIASAQTAGLATGRPTSLRGAVGATKQSPAADEIASAQTAGLAMTASRRGGWLSRVPRPTWLLLGMGLYLLLFNWIDFIAVPIADLSRAIPRGFWSNALYQLADHVKVFFQTPTPLTAIIYTFLSVLVIADGRWQIANRKSQIAKGLLTGGLLALVAALCFMGQPLALIGSPFIIIAAFVVRSLPASVRSGVAALQQIDPSIEEASGMLGADAQ